MVTCLTAVWGCSSNLTAGSCVYHNRHCSCSLRHGLHILTAVARLTELPPCVVIWVSAFRLSNNKWWWWMWMVTSYWRNHSQSRLAWSEGWQPPGTQSAFISWTGWTLVVACHDDSTINIILVIIIINILLLWMVVWCRISLHTSVGASHISSVKIVNMQLLVIILHL